MNSSPHSTALVLGGGGSAGNAWLIGVVAGLHDAGLDVAGADLIVRTSAGSTAAAQITAADPARLYAEVIAAPTPPPGPARSPRGPIPSGHLERTHAIIAASSDITDMRRRIGATALQLAVETGEPALAAWRTTVAARLPQADWPQQRILITAVDAETGVPMIFQRDSGVAMADAVAASCAGGFAYAIAGTWYIDGGYRSNADNADLAAGYVRVLVLSPFGGRSRFPPAWGMHLDAQLEELRAEGCRVETIFPDDASLAAFDDTMMSPSTRPPAARAGFAQGSARAAGLARFWR